MFPDGLAGGGWVGVCVGGGEVGGRREGIKPCDGCEAA